jgi:hypothetical protein
MSYAAQVPDFPEIPEDRGNPDVRPNLQNAALPSASEMKLPRVPDTAQGRFRPINLVFESLAAIGEACVPVVESSVEWMRGVGRGVKRVKDEKPFQLLAVIAGVAFALGAAARFWKEKS